MANHEGPTPFVPDGAKQNTDIELWREQPGDYYSDSIHATLNGGIGINVGGTVYVKPLREWHRLAGGPFRGLSAPSASEAVIPDEDVNRAYAFLSSKMLLTIPDVHQVLGQAYHDGYAEGYLTAEKDAKAPDELQGVSDAVTDEDVQKLRSDGIELLAELGRLHPTRGVFTEAELYDWSQRFAALWDRAFASRHAPPSEVVTDGGHAGRAPTSADMPSAWRWQQVHDLADEVMTRWPAEWPHGDCHLVLTRDVERIRELCRDALAATRDGEVERIAGIVRAVSENMAGRGMSPRALQQNEVEQIAIAVASGGITPTGRHSASTEETR